MDKVVITGGAGFIGSHLATDLVGAGFDVVCFDSLATGYASNLAHLGTDVRLVVGDVRDADAVAAAVSGARWVLHHAAMVSVPESVSSPRECHDVNATGTLNVLEAAARSGVECVTFAASAAAYGTNPTLPKVETMAPEPISPYAATKLLGEHYCATWSAAYGVPCVALRYFNIYGERQDPTGAYAAVISKFLERMGAGLHPVVFGDGLQSRDFCHVSNVVRANRAALERGASATGAPINVGTGTSITLLDLVAALNRVLGTAFEPEHREERAGDVRHSLADISRARAVLGYSPETTLDEGLRRLAASVGAA
ncbi:MAG: SDR family NAD(P)-dependent oxidoreductase [Myxococcales bacterium]|nr:SDR family NAD(P)-dependent oxidoreductase [Myxococcales bacterium]